MTIYRLVVRFLLFCLLICLNLTATAWAQMKTIRVEGEIVAFDKYGPLLQLTNVPETQIFLMKINEIFKGKETGEYIFVIQRNFDNKTSLLELVTAGKYRFSMKLSRELGCDSSIKGLDDIKISGRPEDSKVVPRIEWLRSDLDVPIDERFPCYTLNGKEFIQLPQKP
jgi:hypothetical protein